MAHYYNVSRGPVSFTMRSGTVGSAAPKKWTFVADEEESCADIVRLVQQGLLVRKAELAHRPVKPPKKEAAPKIEKQVVSAPVEVVPVEVAPVEEVKPPKRRYKRSSSASVDTVVAEVAGTEDKGESIGVA